MTITATELKKNLGRYLVLAETEDLLITQYGKVVAKLSNPHKTKRDIATSLFGSIDPHHDLEEVRAEELSH